ncbi:hypothetical protein FVB9288_03242 [Flavobacterium sp. CECT 9288]|uniref:T9SS type B sorting domain-containing protein n=1 Tax=Flavobacterium sp. CECT 9288 TaxID=2845819 RepID=UPI001E5F0A8A|nr:T9SS type B sorting domain-containing protein [Flavobacterium sp. CECT 9288]CAH0337479.1 hypothetical protein FVB9288_03242 [Flavobacterium sp. CECT 9288]
MKKTTFLKVILLTFMFLQSFLSISQNVVPFTRRFDQDIKGDMLLIGNSILNRRSATRNPNDPYNGNNLNSDFSMEYINVDNGATPGIFNSSSANLVVPNPVATSAPCYKIVYAALYWGAVTRGTTPVTNVKFRMPSGGYNDVVGTVIHNSTTPIGTSLPYACVADVTSLVTGTGNPNPEGTYTLANVSTAQGTNRPANTTSGGTGLSAGWSLYIVYEDPKLPAKSITSYDGFSAISSTVNLDIAVTNFRTIPAGPVRGKFAFSALEGDGDIPGDNLSINGTLLSAANSVPTDIRPNTNFFNSSVTYIDPATGLTENYLNRTPNSSNTLGYDAGILNIPNNGNVIIDNNDTSALIGLRSSQDVYFYYFNAIALDIIAPNIVLTKQVFSDASLTNDVGNQNVTRGQELHYAIGFQNIGNDNAENFTITDVLPININFDPNDIVVPNNSGITYVYTAATRTIVFTVPKNLVVVSAPRYRIRFKVRVVSECNELSDVCSNSIQNQAFADYQGEASGIRVDDQRSLATFGACFLGTPAPTNFLVGLDDCIYTRNYQLCGASVVLTAANGYDAYSWSTSPSGTPVIGTTQSITVTQTGTFYVTNFATAPCRTIRQVVTVSPAGSAVTNPVIPFATQTVTCPNNGKLLPKIFLCGANASRLITTGVSDAISIQWQRLNEASCPPVGSDDCANEQTSCTWTTVATGQNYTADTSGQFRVVFNYAGGCFNIFYFNVFKNLLDPTADSRDIICNTTGQITVGGVPATGYEFSLNATGPFQTSNVFPISTPGAYTVYIRQQGVVSNPCLFEVPGIDIRRRNFTVSEFVTQPLCNGDRGTIRLAANDVRGQYSYILRRNGTIVNSSILTNNNFFDFPNLTSGTYTYEVTTEDGCLGTGSIEIREPDILTATVSLTKSLTCESGEITVAPVGGTLPYAIYVNGATTPQFAYQINAPTAGLYDLLIIDANGCRTTTSINVASVPTPVYNTVGTNVNCYGDTTGVINFNMTADNGYTVTYSIDNGLNYGTSGLISGLAAGTYNTILKYTLNGVECLEPMRPITITQPSTALTASAGVSELAGCGPAGEGRVRITNVQGGVAPYEFSFDNQGSWTTVNNALKAPGNYILYVRDRNNCIFQAPVTVDPAPSPPNISIATPVDFNCDGTATSTVTVNNPGNINYTYNYFIDGIQNPNTPSNIFLNVTPGPHDIRIDYQLSTVTTFSNLLFEDFGRDSSVYTNTSSPDASSPGINPAFCWERQIDATRCNNNRLFGNGEYTVTSSLRNNPFGGWHNPVDHTSGSATGRYLAVDAGNAIPNNAVLYRKQIRDIIPNQPIRVRFYATNLLRVGNNQPDASLTVELQNAAGVSLSSSSTGGIPKTNGWVMYEREINPGNNTILDFVLRLEVAQVNGIDFAVDDIEVYQLPRACVTSRTINIEVPTGRAFEAQVNGQRNVSCAGGADGGFTITAQNFDATTGFEYSLNNGGAWSAAQLTSPIVINTLGVNSYNVLVRPVGSTVTACSKSFTVNITAPAAVTAVAAILTPATCTTGATIRATGGGGTPAYQYELRDSNGTSVITAFNTSRDFTNVPAGNYMVFVRDANICSNPVGFPITVTAPPGVTATLATTTDYCYTTANPATLVVNVTGGTGPFTYQLDSNTAESSALTTYPFPNVTPGTHTIVVTDSNNCTSTISNIVIAPQLGFNVSLINDLTCLVDASIGNPVITNGYGPTYTYIVSRDSGTPTAVTSFPFTATQAGSYVFTVTDSRGCPATSNPIVVTPKTTPTHITAKTDITCNGLNNGTITVTPSGGFTTTYTYAIKLSTATAYTTQATSQFTSLAAGTYDIKVIDSKGCESTPTQVTIINPTPIVPNASATAFSCSPTNAPQSATITVAPTGGTGTYTYSYNNGGSFGPSNTLVVNNNGSVQTIRVVVRDANGCLSPMQQIDLQPLNSPMNLTFSNAAVTCTNPTTTVTVTATNGVGALTFLITGTNSGTNSTFFTPATTSGATASFPNLLPGNYTFRVTDANGCYYTESHNIDPVTPIAVAANKTSDVLCQGGSTGSGTYTVSGNATIGAYTFTLTLGTLGTGTLTQSGNVLTLSNVAAGTYTVRVTDTATGCFADGTITINQPVAPLAITNAVATNFNCNNDNAQITVTATGGTTDYGYAAVPAVPATVPTTFASSAVVTVDTNNGTILNWVVYVRDANGCTTSRSVTIAGDPAPAPPVVTVPNQCSATGSGFTITVTPVTGPLGPYTYGISGITGAFQTADTFNVAPGSYTVFVRDRNGCFSTGTAVTVAAQLTAGAAVTKPLDCTATPNAIITTTINGGQANYSYVITDSIGNTVASNSGITGPTFTYSPTIAGTYTIVINDAIGCTTTTSATVAPIADPSLAVAAQVNVSCNGGSNGSVTLIGSGGSGGYLYSNDNITFGPSATFTNLAAGTYTFYVRDSKECDTSINVTITEPANALVATADVVPFECNASNAPVAGTVTVNVTSGTGTAPYTYSFNGGAFTNNNVLTINNTTADVPYTYIVRDALGCTVSGNGTLFRLNNPVIGTITSTRILCQPITATTSTVTVPVNAGTGVGTLSYTIVSGPVTNATGATTGVFSGLTSGNYVFRVTDANGCYDTESYFVAPVTPIVATATKLTDVDCFNNTTGSIRYNVSGFGTGSYSYTVNGGTPVTAETLSPFDLTTLGAGTYNVIFTDEVTGCTVPTSVTITQPAQALAATYTTVNANCKVPTASVTVTATGGTSTYRYSFVTSSTTPGTYGISGVANLNPTTSTTWYAHIIDANNCTFILPITIATDPIPTVTATATGQCLGSGPYTITASGLGGVGTLSYSINGGASYQAGNTFTVTTSGNYTITVKDANNCTSTSNVIAVAPQLTLNAILNKDITCNPAPTDAQITLTPTGGVGPFTYTASPATGTFAGNVFTTNAPGSYTFTVTDTTTGCTFTTTAAIPVTAPTTPVITAVTQSAFINCNGDDTAAITIAIDNTQGQSPFVFNVRQFSDPAFTILVQDFGTQTSGLPAGYYVVTLTDAKGCTVTETITINEPPAIIVTSTSTPITCNGAGISKGSVIVQSVTGGVGPYNYFVTGVNGYNNSELNNLGTTSVAFNVVDFGIYQINVVDFNGCSVLIQNVKVASPPDDLDISVIPPPADCSAPGSAVVSVGSSPTSTIGAGPFYFSIYTGSATVYPAGTWLPEDAPGSKQTTFPNLIPGVTYTFVVFDADVANGGTGTGCYYYETSTIPIPTNSTITVNPLTPNNITCRGAADGNVTFTINQPYGVATPVTYQIYNSQSVTPVGPAVAAVIPATGSLVVNNFGTLPFGSYFVLVTETGVATNSGCSISSTRFDITESAIDLTITAQKIKNINCNEDGIIAAFASNGTGPYTYQYLLDTVTAPTAGTSGWVTNTTFATSVPGNYIVYVKDDYGCIKSDDVILLQDAPPTIAVPAPICYNGTPFTIDLVTNASASATILPATYKVEPIASLGSATYQNGSTFTLNAAGTYRLYIKDGNGCVAFVDYTVHPQLELIPTLTKGLDCTGTPNATITLNTTGGNPLPTPGNYTYEVNFNSGGFVAATTPYSAAAPGTYEFRVTDANNATICQATATIVLDPIPATVIATPIVTNVSCNGGNDGTITINVTSGVGPYEYSLFDGVTTTAFTTNNTFTGLVAGTAYVVTVRNDRDCLQASPAITIAEPAPLTATASAAANTTCSTTTLITVNTPTGGTSSGVGTGYTYSFNGLSFTGDNTFTVNNGPLATTTTIVVRDANNCTFTLPSVVTPALTPPTDLSFAVTTAPTCTANSATVQVTVTGGLGTPAFEIISPATATGNTSGATSGAFTLLAPGDYIFQVTDDNGCTRQELFTVDPVTPIAIVGALVNDITCNPANGTTNNGSASFTVTGFSTSLGYSVTTSPVVPAAQITNVGDVITLTGLGAGTYTVTVRDNTTLCEAFDDITITLPNPITFAPTATKVYCTEDDSIITVGTVSGGTGVYEYAAVPASSTAPTLYSNIPVLSVDTVNGTVLTWDVYVRDANGCLGIVPVTIVNDAEPTIVAPAAQCYTGTPLTVDLDAVTTVYLGSSKIYTLDGSVVAGPTVTLNGPGTYVLGIRDDNGCEDTVNYTVVDQLIAGAVLAKDLTCAPTPAATINVTITGGVGLFTVQTLVGGVPTGAPATGVTGPLYTINPTTAGTYSFVITDSYSPACSVTTNPVEVTTPVPPTFTAVATDATCNGDSNGTITVTPTAGVAPFTFALSGPVVNSTGNATGNYSGLPAGSYTVTITDAKGCPATSTTPIIIGQPIVVSATISVTTPLSCGTGNVTQAATVTAVPSGGNGSYQYNFNGQGFTPSNTFVTNTAGPVSVIVRDTNGCSFATAVGTTVIALDPPTNMDISGSLIYCAPATSTTSTVTINTVTNGVGPFTYQMVSPSVINNFGSNSFAGLAAGDYIFQVTDANGCTYQELYTVAPSVNIAATVATITNETCFNANDGAATFTVSNSAGYTANLTLGTGTLAQSGNTVTLSALLPGNYSLQVVDTTTGCTADVPFTIAGVAQVLDFNSTATNINCNNDEAIITVTATGGTLDYKYAVALATAPAPAVTAYGLSNTLTVDTNNGTNMNWIVYVLDGNGCPINKPQTILVDANPTIASAVATQCPSATGTYNITVTASGFSPALEYSADGSNYQSGNVITVNAPGNYNITVRDANGCISAATGVAIVNPLILTPVVSIPVSCTGGDGQITVSTTGGSGNFVYNIDGAPFAAVTAFNAVAAGNHIIGVRDTTTLCEVFVPVNLQAATLVTGFALAKSDVTCNGGTDGRITATIATPAPGVNDNPVYLYSLNSGLPQASNVFSNLAAGTYTVRVISSRGCDATATIIIDEPGLITVPAPAVVQFGCASGNISNLATITVTGVNGGSGTYLNYEFLRNGTRVQFGNSNVYTETVLTGGNYTVNVFDNRGCVGSTTTAINIAPYVALDAVSVAVNRPITCAVLENITVSVTTIGGTATNLEYTIVYKDPITGALTGLYPTTTNTDGIFTNLPIGDYNITVRNLDTGCEIRAVHFVNNPNTFDLVVNATTDITCLNDTNGTATLTLVDRLITTTPVNGNDAGPFSYTLQNAAGLNVGSGTAANAGPITLTGLAAGTYTISATLSQTPDCTVTTNFTIAAPATALDITETHTEITCVTGNNDGSISVAATGGWPGSYQFELVGPTPAQSVAYGTQTVFTGLTAGSYTVNVRDSKGCVNSEIVVLNNPTPIAFVAVPSTTLVSCINDTSARITVTTGPTGGSGSYLYTLIRTNAAGVVTTNGPQISNTFNNLGAGTYQVRVSDSWTCSTTSANIVINEPTRVTAALTLATAKTCATDARLTLTAAGGTAPYTYSTTANFATATAMIGNTATFSVPVGTHSYYIRDNNGCVSFISNEVKIEEVPTLTLALDVQNATINCTGDASGVIVALAQGGLGNYVYTLLDSTGNPVPFTVTQTTPGNFTNIPAGNYVVRVVSQDCAAVTSSIVPITEPLVALTQSYVVTPITCAGEGDGRIVITASGGTGIIKYAISPRLDQFFESGVFENLRPGFYEYIVQDENGCFINIKDIEITEPRSVFATVVPNSAVPEVCAGDADGAFSINITGGNAPYSVSLNNRNGTYTTGTLTQTQFDFTGLSGNEQIVYIRDANGCESDISIMLGEPVTLNPVADVNYDCVNNSQVNSVTITVAAGNAPADLDYSLDGLAFQSSNVFNNLSAGRHTVDVRHTNGCIKQVIFDVDQINPITISLSDGGLNEIVSTVTGGYGNYQYSLNGEPQGSQGNFIIYKSGDYTVTVTDANGCSATATRYFEFIDIKIPNVFTPNGDGNNDTWAPTNTINYKDLIFEVFDRYGRKIGTYREGQSWNGKYNGNELPSGDYWYILRLRNVQDAREFVGHFTLYR